MPLTDTACKNAKPGTPPKAAAPTGKSYKLTDGGGLHLEVRPNGSKLWRYRFRLNDEESTFAIGSYPDVSLAEARKARDEARALVKQGINPSMHRKAEKLVKAQATANTFEAVAREWVDKKRGSWTAYYLKQVESFMASDVYPKIGKMPIADVKAAHLLAILQAAEKRGAPTVAILIRQWCGAIFRYAVATLRAEHDPAAALKGAVHRPPVKHHRHLERDEIPTLLTALDTYRGRRQTVIAIRLLLLNFTRTWELRAATWGEFDLDGALWTIPAERMKKRRAHHVPLARQSVELLRELHKLNGHREFLFPNLRTPGVPMGPTTINRALEYLGFDDEDGFSGHGFRGTAATMLQARRHDPKIIDLQLAHMEKSAVKRAYFHAEHLPERRALLQEWADLIDEIAKQAKVAGELA
ncbi:tyrosine-type recombinase/integrase [Thauera terpenica]